MKKLLKEGPIPPADNAGSVRSIRGLVAATNDTGPGIPAPTSRQPVTRTYASKGTTSSDGSANLQNLNPEAPTSNTPGPGTSRTPTPPFNYAQLGNTTTQTLGFGRVSPSGTGLKHQRRKK